FLPPTPVPTMETFAHAIESRRAMEREIGYAIWAVDEMRTGRFIGQCGIRPAKSMDEREWWSSPSSHETFGRLVRSPCAAGSTGLILRAAEGLARDLRGGRSVHANRAASARGHLICRRYRTCGPSCRCRSSGLPPRRGAARPCRASQTRTAPRAEAQTPSEEVRAPYPESPSRSEMSPSTSRAAAQAA